MGREQSWKFHFFSTNIFPKVVLKKCKNICFFPSHIKMKIKSDTFFTFDLNAKKSHIKNFKVEISKIYFLELVFFFTHLI